jgi:hypothetical protein
MRSHRETRRIGDKVPGQTPTSVLPLKQGGGRKGGGEFKK